MRRVCVRGFIGMSVYVCRLHCTVFLKKSLVFYDFTVEEEKNNIMRTPQVCFEKKRRVGSPSGPRK
jgi:hypothetical protein